MFYSQELLTRNDAIFYVVWQYATKNDGSVDKREVLSQNVPSLCDSIVKLIPDMQSSLKQNSKKLSLYLLAQLVHGTILIFRRQVDFLQKDGERLMELMKRTNLVFMKAKEYDRELKKKEKDKRRSRSKAIIRLEEEEDRNVLENIDRIGDELGINARLTDITITDTIPWVNLDSLAEELPLYGPMDTLPMNNDFLARTFVDGYPSDSTDKEVMRDASNIFTPSIKVDKPKKRRYEEPAVRDAPQDIQPITEVIDIAVPPPQPLPAIEDLNANTLIDKQTLEQPSVDIFQSTVLAPNNETINQPLDLDFQPVIVPPIVEPSVEQQQEEEEKREDEKLEEVKENREPPAKKHKESLRDVERIRDKSVVSRPVTPANNKSVLKSTVNTPQEQLEEKSFELESQIIDELPKRVTNRKRPVRVHQDNMQISHEEMKMMRDDCTSLLRTKEELMITEPKKFDLSLEELLDPSPYFYLKKWFPQELRSLYRSGTFQNRGTRVRDEDEMSILDEEEEEVEKNDKKEEIERFYSTLLIDSPLHRTRELEEEPIRPPLEEPHLMIEEPPIMMENLAPLPPLEMNQSMRPPIEETPAEVRDTIEPVENVRRRPKSSLGVKVPEAELIYDSVPIIDSLPFDSQDKDDQFLVSSGLLFDLRPEIKEELMSEINRAHPDWLNFNVYASKLTRKKAACAFSSLLVELQNDKVRVKQASSFATIYVQQVLDDVSTMSLEDW